MNIHDDLDLEWADIEGEGLIRVFPISSFKAGFVFLAHVGLAAEKVKYFPIVVLSSSKLTITIPANDDGLDHRLAHAIDTELANATQN